MNVLPATSPPFARAARLTNDEAKLRAWYESLPMERRGEGGDGWYTLHELRSAVGIPMSRLPSVLYRLGWFSARKRGWPVRFWHGPSAFDPIEGP